MSRSILPVVCIVVAIAVGVLQSRGPARSSTVERAPDGVVRDGGPSDSELASLRADARSERAPVAGSTTRWSVVVQDASRRPIPGARIVARQGSDSLEARGSAEWSGLADGEWELLVTARDLHEWRRLVTVPPGRTWTTIVTVGVPIRVSGLVRDTSGAPRYEHLVGFVLTGDRAPSSPLEWLGLPHARTGRSGAFEAVLPGAGTYRLFVGYAGRIVHEDAAPVKLTEAGPSRVDIVIPEPTRLLVAIEEEEGQPLRHPYGVSVYRSREILDVERPLPPQVVDQARPDPNDPSLDEETRRELIAQIQDDEEGLTPEQQALMELRLSVVPDGWRVDRSAIVDSRGELTLEFLPAGEELRFAASRGQEPFRVEGSAWLVEGESNRVVITVPAPLPAGTAIGPEARVATLRLEPAVGRKERVPVGSDWN